MSQVIKPCPFRAVNGDGQILCQLIKGNDREITLDICQACPVSQINCQHLRASLDKQDSVSVTVRFVTGRTEVWNDRPPAVAIKHAACAEKAMPIYSPRDCAGCPIRLPQVVPQGVLRAAREYLTNRTSQAAAVSSLPSLVSNASSVGATPVDPNSTEIAKKPKLRPVAGPPAAAPPPPQLMQNRVQSKIIQLEKWLATQMHKKGEEDPTIVRDIATRSARKQASSAQPMSEKVEKCVGWTD